MRQFNLPSVHIAVDGLARGEAQADCAGCSMMEKERDFDMEEEWSNSKRDAEFANRSRRRERHGGYDGNGGDDSAINLRVTVVADNGNLCVFHKLMASGDPKPVGIPVNRIATISVSQTNGTTLIITSEGTVAVSESFEDAMQIYEAARPIAFPESA